MRAFFLSLMVLAGAVSMSGCILLAAGAAGVGTAKWLSDKVSEEVDRPMANVAMAAKDALQGMRLKVYKETNAAEVTQLLAKYTDGRQVWVDVHQLSANNSRVDVRVGWASGTADARDILKKIVSKAKGWF